LEAIRAAFESDKVTLDLLLEAQRRLAEAESRYFRALAEYAVAVKNVHFAKGTLLDYDGVYLSEGGWPIAAYQDAAVREQRRGQPHPLNYASSKAPRVSYGPYDQRPGSVSHTVLPLESSNKDNAQEETDPAIPLVPQIDEQAGNSLIPVWKPETISRLQTPSISDPTIAPASFTDDELHALPAVE
jgi:hypothetical protein